MQVDVTCGEAGLPEVVVAAPVFFEFKPPGGEGECKKSGRRQCAERGFYAQGKEKSEQSRAKRVTTVCDVEKVAVRVPHAIVK
ncbi:MAG: hypothetical protein ACR2PG_00460 [Hyphomicrobiaceae bacterium]